MGLELGTLVSGCAASGFGVNDLRGVSGSKVEDTGFRLGGLEQTMEGAGSGYRAKG